MSGSRSNIGPSRGFTLIELMVTVAILAVIAMIAIPAYQGYIRESRLSVAKTNADSMRIFLEDFRLDNGTYKAGGLDSLNETQMFEELGWSADGDDDPNNDPYTYTVTVFENTYHILAEHQDGDWLFCENGLTNCCDNETAGATKTNCP